MAVSNENKRFNVTISKEKYQYLEKIVNIYNVEVLKDNFRIVKKNYKLSVSALYDLAISNLILQIDKLLDTSKSLEENHKSIYKFLGGK